MPAFKEIRSLGRLHRVSLSLVDSTMVDAICKIASAYVERSRLVLQTESPLLKRKLFALPTASFDEAIGGD